MKGRTSPLLISAVLILGMCFAETGISWDHASPPATGASSGAQTAAAPAAPANNETPAQTTTPPAKSSAAAATPDTKNVPVTEVIVKAEKEKKNPKEGSAEVGYKAENTTATGPWGEMKLQDAPYSISVMSAELIENVQAASVIDVYRINPFTQPGAPASRGLNTGFIIRGFNMGVLNGRIEDGIHATTYQESLEDKEQVEVITGLTSFLYGPGNVGGVVNFVNKRPTWAPLYSLTVGNYGGSNYYVHGDFGGPIYKDRVAYRLNLLTQDGDTAVDYNSIRRNLASGAVDWRATDSLLLQFNGAHEESRLMGGAAAWLFSTNAKGAATAFHGPAPDATKDWGQKFGVFPTYTDKAETRLTWNLSDIFTFRSAFRYSTQDTTDSEYANNNVTSNNGTYSQTIYKNTEDYWTSKGGYAFMDAKFRTGPIENKVTAGYYGDREVEQYGPVSYASSTLSNLNFNQPTYIAEPSFGGVSTTVIRKADVTESRNWVLGDEIKFNKAWSALIGGNYTEILAKNYSTTTGLMTSQYDQTKPTPSASLLYKPIPWITTYATYIQSLEQGTIVPATGSVKYTNGGQALAPYTSDQYEIGAKATLGGALLTAALFDIERALQYAMTNSDGTRTYVQSGREEHKGFEFTVTGKVTTNLTLWGGLTLMDAEVKKNAANPQWNGKVPVNVAQQVAKLYGEYAISAIPGLSLTGGVYYTGRMYADSMNTDTLPAVFTEDIGARYTTTLDAHPLILRLNVSNLTNESYWISNIYVGDPRRIMFSAQVKF